MDYRLVIFDFDGTLADSLPWLSGVFGELAREFGFRHPDAVLLEELRRSAPREAMTLLRVPRWKVPLIAARVRNRMAQELGAIHPFEGVTEILRRMDEAGVILSVVSSNSRRNVERVLGRPAADRIAHYSCGTSLFGKASHFRRVLARSKVPASEALCVGDEIRDARAARSAGIAFGAVGWGYHSLEALRAERPAEVFERVADLSRLASGAGLRLRASS
ncbi:MAG TPA: HAD hydrolase-like protein [Anaeromyxobacter sp.]|nr:HAD hydrolase-like protein [Anaeromyxobacter sp.]